MNRKVFFIAGLSVVLLVLGMNINHALDGYGIPEMASIHAEFLSQSNSGTSSCAGNGSANDGGCSCGCGSPCCSCGGSSSGGNSSGGSSSGNDSSGGSSSGGNASSGCTPGVSTSSTGTLITKVCDRMSDENAPTTKEWCTVPMTNYTCYYDNKGNGSPM